MKRILICVVLIFISSQTKAQTETFPSGSFIINMGVSTQTIANGLKPYGLIYEMLKTYHVPIKWVIGSSKIKDAKDFTYASTDYKGGTFIIPADFITPSVSTSINAWVALGVSGTYTNTSITLKVTQTLTSVPSWTLNPTNVSISKSFFADAGIPTSSYNSANATALGACNDIFVMPHADPTWVDHGNLYNWNRNYKGAVWAGCHAVSVMESLVNPSDSSQKLNFLTTKGLINYNSHNDGSVPYSYFFNRGNYNGSAISARPDDAVFQMMGTEDAAHTNGSEQVYIPKIGSAWRNTTHIGCYDSIQSNVNANASNGPAAITLYGRGFGLSTAGYVMYQGGHDIEGTNAANVSAVRQFFNFSFKVMADKVPSIASLTAPTQIQNNTSYHVSVSASSPIGSTLFYQWTANCLGTFANANTASTTFTPTGANKNSNYILTCEVTDACSRYSFSSTLMTGIAPLPVTLINFTGTYKNNLAQIEWSTSSEDNFKEFELLYSIDGKEFHSAGFVKGHGLLGGINNYIFYDNKIETYKKEVVFYRLKMVNHDGSFNLSDLLKLAMPASGFKASALNIYPNPALEQLNVELLDIADDNFFVTICDAFGKKISTFNNLDFVGNKLTIDLNLYNYGIYFLRIENSLGIIETKKIIKR